MKKHESIGFVQTAILLFAYLSGSSIIVIPSPVITYASNSAWLSILLSMMFGLVILSVILYLLRLYPDKSFIGICRAVIGRWPTVIVACLMLTMAFHMASGIIIDVVAFMNSMMLPETPGYIFMCLMFIMSALLLRTGIESMARMFTILTIVVFLFWLTVIVLLIPSYQLDFLQPVFPDGMKPTLLGSYLTSGFPYGEIVLFAVILPFTRDIKSKPLKRSLVLVILLNGAMLTVTTLSTIMVLGPIATDKKYSLFVLAQTIEIGDMLERIEAIIGMSMIAGSLMKASITLFAIQTIITELFGLQDHRLLSNPLCLLVQIMSLSMPTTMKAWENLVLVIHPLWVGIAYILPLLLVTIVATFKQPARAAPA
ncbi:GerAB/ArcD/ProY family transporter [Paenibacillus kobensis]|uniref:GerAB/ArcD/ProY family transporter n=1 Tax=Paenibacillus kobensis TaxID=59841 RepID=UPI0013E3EAF1|nr:endospore germination permease [Paenibacillus kobensis]